MEKLKRWVHLLVIFFLFNLKLFETDAAREVKVCGRTKCHGNSIKFKYIEGTVYRYQHQVDVSVNLGNGSSISELHIESVALLKFTTPCEADLKISKASIRHANRGKYDAEFPDRAEADFKEQLEHYSLRFVFEDGQIQELCPHSEDPIWSVNIKRGILSMLQNTMKRFDVDHHGDELDVNGICETRYRLHEARKTSLIIVKTKDIDSCTNRGKHFSIIQSNMYTSPRTHSQGTLLDSKYNCEIILDHNIYENVICKESYQLKHLSYGNVAVRSEVISKLTLIDEGENSSWDDTDDNDDDDDNDNDDSNDEEQNETEQLIESIPTDLLYDHAAVSFSSKTLFGELRISRDLLKTMCLLGSSGQLEKTFSEIFSKFIHSARHLDYPSLSQLLVKADGICENGKRHILDALPYIGTSAAVKVMRDSMLKKIIDKERSESWLTAIALIPRPDASTVAALLPLLELEHQVSNGHLTLVYSAVVHAFCRHHGASRQSLNFHQSHDCLAIQGTGIDRFFDYLESTIEQGCAPKPHEPEEVKKTLEALKAIGNMGLERTGLSDKLKVCIDNEGGFISMETRIAAIEAHRRLPSCQETRDRIFLPRYRNITLEPEIRIASYLQTMRCPDYNVVKIIKHTLTEEPINQVGSFVWSHLTNLLASSSPTKIEIQSLLTDRDLSDKYNSDGRKFSRNYEKSFFSEEFNVGGTFQTNVVFSSKSYVPRTLTFNMTLDLFGESVNVIEVTMRMEGMEYYAEKFFGPTGPFANDKISQHITNFLRSLRSVSETNHYWEDLKTIPNIIDNNFNNPQISLSYKIFGNELEFIMLNGPDEIVKTLTTLNPLAKIKRLLSGREIYYEYTGMLLDASYIIPTAAGLPIRLDLTGSAACNFKFSGLLNSDRFVENTEVQLVGNVTPSVSLDITGQMSVDAFHKSASVKIQGNVYSSSAVRLHLDVQGIRLVKLNLEVPNRKLEVLTVRTDILHVHGNGAEISERPVVTSTKNLTNRNKISNSTCSWPVLERLIGLKLCFDYLFPNITEADNISYFILNGPTLFRTSIIKADPSAESYLFEYSWKATPTNSVLKLAFDTPGSLINRETSATVSFDAKTHNVSVLLRSAGNSLVALGTYKRTDDETMINIGLDINGTKHVDGCIGYLRKSGNYGYIYIPKLDLKINDENVVELSGMVKDTHKNNVTQWDIDLSFQTKKIKSRMRGYIIRRTISLTGNIKLDYQLKNMNKETLQVEISLLNRSTKTLVYKEANLMLQSSAYPQLNAIITTWYQQALGHLEIHTEINTKPHLRDDRHKLTIQLILTYSKAYFQSQEAKMTASVAIRKPIQNIDIKVGVERFSIGPSSKTYFLVRYAPGKEITLAVNLIMPRGAMFAIEGHANMTIPNLDSMLIDVRITEKSRGEYDLDFAGTWFSGHNATIRGTYVDKLIVIKDHRVITNSLKLLFRSPSLARDILFNYKFYRDHIDTKFDISVEYLDADKYALAIHHSVISAVKFISYAEARCRGGVYTVTAAVDVEREVRLELHLDNWRDVHLIATGINEETTKEFGFEIKWDANRDPAMRFATLLQLYKMYEDTPIHSRNLSSTIMVTYPGRLFTGTCFLGVLDTHHYLLDAKIEWDPVKNIHITIDADYDTVNWSNYFKFESKMLTPFEQWKKTSLNARYHWTDEELKAVCDAHWQDDQRFNFEFASSSQETLNTVEWRANCGLTSTVHSVGWITTNLTHKVSRESNSFSTDSRLLVNYNPDKVMDFKSVWHFNGATTPNDNITFGGNFKFLTPFMNYKNGDVKLQFRFMPYWKFHGLSNIEIDKRKYTGILQGDLARIKESIVEFNITTPLEKYSFIRGRFGLSEINKHAVAEVTLPSGPIGVEALCKFFAESNYDFNIMLRVSTPIEILQKFLIVAKLARTEADFRIGYNNVTAGFQAIWHFNNLTNFHYSYILFTPIHGLHESGIVAKIIILDKKDENDRLSKTIDTEFSLRIVETKLGIKIYSGPKLSPLKLLDEPLVELSYEPEDDDFSWQGDIEINAVIIEPIIGKLEIDKHGRVYQINGNLIIPQGKIFLEDKFILEDVFNMKNTLEIKTPFEWTTGINSLYVFSIDMENYIYFMSLDVNLTKNDSIPWIECGIKGNYSSVEHEDDSTMHKLQLIFNTPQGFLGYLDSYGTLELDENIYKTNIVFKTNDSFSEFTGVLELEEAFFDGTLIALIDSPILQVPKTKITIKKDFTELEKRLEGGITIDNSKENHGQFRATWYFESQDHIKLSVELKTWILPLKNVQLDLFYDNNLSSNQSLLLETKFKRLNQKYKLSGAYHPNKTLNVQLQGPSDILDYDYRFDGLLDSSNKLTGNLVDLKTSQTYNVNGEMDVTDSILEIKTVIVKINEDSKENNPCTLTLLFFREKYGLKLNAHNDFLDSNVSLNYINALNWDTNFALELENNIKYQLDAFTNVQVNGNTSIYIKAQTPWPELKVFQLDGNVMFTNNSGDIKVKHHLNNNSGYLRLAWKLAYMTDMFIRFNGAADKKDINVFLYLDNPKRAFRSVNTGFDISVNEKKWQCATNISIGYRDNENIDYVMVVHLPPPNNDDHRILIRYHAQGGLQDANFVIGYSASKAMINYATDGSIRMAQKNIDGHLRLAWDDLKTKILNNIFNITFDEKKIGFKYSLFTPKSQTEEKAIVLFNYDGGKNNESLINADFYYTPRKKVGTINISYLSLTNVNGTLNVSTGVPNFPYVACNFIVLTTLKQTKRFVQVFWQNDTALINSDYVYHSEKLDSDLIGIIELEVPLSTRHIANLNYGYKKKSQVTTGYADLIYNKDKILLAKYNSKGESRAGIEKDSIQITLENDFQPLGITYTNQYEYSAGNAGTNYPTIEQKRINIYRLDNSSIFNVAGQSQVRTFHEGQEIQLKAEHLNKTVQLNTDYRVLPGEFDHNCWVKLAEGAWASYNLNIINKTTEEIENQFLTFNLAYPWRNITVDGSYSISLREFNTEGNLSWKKTYNKSDPSTLDYYYDEELYKTRQIGAAFNWTNLSERNDTVDKQVATLSFKHPSLEKDASIAGYLNKRNNNTTMLNATVIVDYSENPDKLVELVTIIKDESVDPNYVRYSYFISGKHPRTRLDLDVSGYIEKNTIRFIKTDHQAVFRRSYFPGAIGKFLVRFDANNYQTEYHRESTDLTKHLDISYYPTDVAYIVNGSVIDTSRELNATGVLYFNYPEKLTWLMLNYTPDSVESLRMYGNIPDARNGVFDVWRTYERNLIISDISFYLRLNHSRLVTSTLKWRPELKSDLTNFVKTTVSDFCNDLSNDLDYWKQYVKSEIINSASDIWEDAHEDIEELLNDWNNLKELDEDLDKLKVYLNESYNANDFYIKDLVGIGIYVIDELALRSHIESLPNIINEIWEIMGESGEAIRNSLLWIIEATKNAYKKLTEIVSAILKGESITQIANIIEQIVEKYDRFIKDLHVSFKKYVENLWNKLSITISRQWDKILRMVEPIFIRILHYLEAVLWKASKEIVDFLYDRRNELIKSPYFDRFTNFTQDFDKFYRDIKANDIITNIYKYTGIVITFIRERYFTMVPFGEELKDLVDEIISEFAELKKLPTVNYALEKFNYVYERIHYFYNYFGVRKKVENFVRVIHSKLIDISQTALQAESKYREAKTKFIFDPNTGLMCLEQKLPMSWHAFNQTPEFQEIPEYRAILDLRNYFTTSNATFWTLYYRYRPYTDPSNWFPPFKAQAMVVGNQHFITFDGQHYDFINTGTYLLAHDFIQNQFAVFITYQRSPTNSSIINHKIIVSVGRQDLQIDVFNDTVKLADSTDILRLPVELDNNTGFVYQEKSIVIVELKNNQFKLKCNLKYDICVIELSGWFFGKTAGLLGTMNNERWDDTIKSDGVVTDDIEEFAKSWSISKPDDDNIDVENKNTNLAYVGYKKSELFDFCFNLFTNHSSEFGDCFMVVEPQYYAAACLNTRSTAEVCSLAIAYMQVCGFYDTYLRIPDKCTACSMTDNSSVPEGEFRKLEMSSVPNSTDVVFIVEAKLCNINIRQNRSIDLLVTQLNKELNENGLKDNRWSLVIFGGDGVFDKPRSLILGSQIFTNDTSRFVDYFDNIPSGFGSQDVFAAIGFASQLVFRAGVSKTFILLPCSHCEPQNQTLDYSVLHQVLLEHDITFHILMDGDFNFKKQRLNKTFYGIDATKSYTKKDAKVLIGDIDLRRQVKLPKSTLGYCTPLSLETNGTIFSGNKLNPNKSPSIKKFASTFAKRVALTAKPSSCQHCECSSDNDGVTHMECMPCVYPMPVIVDYVSETFNEDDTFSPLQPLEVDYSQIDVDDD
ncbi:uncharacterized protein Apoltp [Chelonus insularis]|uniref:uncharacterized protein Apoltp n=1 Tax=Chelonus insularis TaxID=460826 RepID=UPI00158D90DC|nr:uncharacterized protein LOC118065838 [Chelonus insularis]